MPNKKPLKSISTGSLVALGLSVSSLYSGLQAAETAFETKEIPREKHQPGKMEGMACGANMQMDKTEMVCGSNMRMDVTGMVMYENKEKLPKDCKAISEDVTIEVKAGIDHAKPYPGTVFGLSEHQWEVKPCSRITVEFTNEDEIRHQWMIHGLPKYLYPEGMFHIEVNGKGKKTGTFIVPSSNYTYLVHCDIAQHMEKGMKAQLKVGTGRGNLPSIPGISAAKFADSF